MLISTNPPIRSPHSYLRDITTAIERWSTMIPNFSEIASRPFTHHIRATFNLQPSQRARNSFLHRLPGHMVTFRDDMNEALMGVRLQPEYYNERSYGISGVGFVHHRGDANMHMHIMVNVPRRYFKQFEFLFPFLLRSHCQSMSFHDPRDDEKYPYGYKLGPDGADIERFAVYISREFIIDTVGDSFIVF